MEAAVLKVYKVQPDHMDKPPDWRDRLLLASDPITNDLGQMDVDQAEEALRYIEALEAQAIAWKKAAQSATPGGSEYTEPHECAARIRELKNDLHRAKCDAVLARR